MRGRLKLLRRFVDQFIYRGGDLVAAAAARFNQAYMAGAVYEHGGGERGDAVVLIVVGFVRDGDAVRQGVLLLESAQEIQLLCGRQLATFSLTEILRQAEDDKALGAVLLVPALQ